MKGNNYNLYKLVHNSLYDSAGSKESKGVYKNDVTELLTNMSKLSKKKYEATESEGNQPKTILNVGANTYNQYLTLTKSERHRKTTSGNHSLSKSQSQKPIKIEHGSKAKELISLINTCVNHDFTFTPDNSQVLGKISKSLKVCQNLDELLLNEMVVDHLMSLVCKYIFRKPKYKSKTIPNNSHRY
jgi:hypothetical protein